MPRAAGFEEFYRAERSGILRSLVFTLHDPDLAVEVTDEAEEDELVPARSGTHPEIAHERAPRKPRGRVLTFLRHCADELRRVQWPNRRQVGQATAVVLGFVVLAGGYLGLLDALWKPIVDAIL